MRSKYETRVGQYLKDRNIQYAYECTSYEYDEPLRKNRARCAECGSTHLLRTGWYTPDFFLGGGGNIIIETKGRFTAADRRKMVAVKRDHPDLDIRLLFMRNNKLTKRSHTTYTEWCDQHDYISAVGMPPDTWLEETRDEETS